MKYFAVIVAFLLLAGLVFAGAIPCQYYKTTDGDLTVQVHPQEPWPLVADWDNTDPKDQYLISIWADASDNTLMVKDNTFWCAIFFVKDVSLADGDDFKKMGIKYWTPINCDAFDQTLKEMLGGQDI